MRTGKTKRDEAGGSKRRNASNKAARAAWQKLTPHTNDKFPSDTCNGHRNRSQ